MLGILILHVNIVVAIWCGCVSANGSDLIRRISSMVKTSMSNSSNYDLEHTSWTSINAIDNNYLGDPNTCGCCSSTKENDYPWWQIDLGNGYLIESVTIIGRTNGGNPDVRQQYSDLWIYVGNSNLETNTGSLVYHGNPNNGSYRYFLQETFPRFFQYLMIKKMQRGIMTICEVQIIEKDSQIKILPNLKDISVTRQSTTFLNSLNFNSSNAIDGVENYDIDNCKCCSVTKADHLWWRIDLDKPYLIGGIEVFGRQSGDENQLQHAIIIARNTTTSDEINIATIPTLTPMVQHYFKILDTPVIAQYFTVELKQQDILTICEFRLFTKECDIGKFGNGCFHQCHCLDRKMCDAVTGHCQSQGCLKGWIGEACDTCLQGYFGNNCNKTCHCKDGAACHMDTGQCPMGCAPGWQGIACNQACDQHKFGDGCKNTCHCTSCDPVNGTCYSAPCDRGWEGKNCSQDLNLISQLENKTIPSQSTIYTDSSNFGPFKAIDGIEKYDVDSCECCSVTEGDSPSWWQINLQNKYLIGDIEIFGRQNGATEQLQNAQIHAGNTTINGNISALVITTIQSFSPLEPQHFFKTLDQPIIAQYISVVLQKRVLTICEFRLFTKVCDIGKFGNGCSHDCHCSDNRTCNEVTGQCKTPGCVPGWMGTSCDIECSDVTYGADCNYTCHCKDNRACDKVSGVCPAGCAPGWKGEACDHACDVHTFGENCNNTCYCASCDRVNGTCNAEECYPGWQGISCSQECNLKFFGENCSRTCHCLEGSCHHINGTCDKLRFGCQQGWQGESCDYQVFERSTGKEGSETVALAAGTSAAIIVVVVAFALVLFVYRRHKSSKNQNAAKSFSHIDEALRQKQQRQIRTDSSQSSLEDVRSTYTETNTIDQIATTDETESGGGYYDFADVVGIRIHELWDYIHNKTKNECQKLYEEFKNLPSGLIHPCLSADHIANRGKNRYRKMYAYDRTRVVLEEKNDKGTDYVNANYIDGYNMTRKFVACQGPTKQMVYDFWRMVWQLKSDKIIMLTNLVEQGGTKCIQYWPKDEECSYGKINIKVVKLDTDLDFDIRYLDVSKDDESPRRVRQYHFKSWPDKDVPDSTWCLVKFWRAVQTDAESKAGPIVVHCSAGIGRTGTFIALDNLIHQARNEGCVRPFQMVQALREQRVNMVQTKEQYVYLHEVLADALSFGTHFVWSTQFEAVYMSLLEREDGEVKTRLEVQYNLIQKSLKDTGSQEVEPLQYSNMETILSESDAYRPKLRNRGSMFVQQLGATFILASCDLGAQNDKDNKFQVNKVEEKSRKGFTERTFTFKELHREEENNLVTVKQFEFTAWNDGCVVPGDARSLVDFLDAILNWQPHLSESQPVFVCDSDGCARSGILCVALNEVNRIKTEGGHINIVQSVKTMKTRNSQFIHNFEQYKFCYDLILAFLKQTDMYQNLK